MRRAGASAPGPSGRPAIEFVVVGSANVDVVLRTGRLPRHHQKVRAERSTIAPGGAGANTAVWLARRGRKVALVSAVGADPLGDAVLADVVAEGVDARFVARDGDTATGVAVVLSDGTGKRMVTTGGPPLDGAMEALPRDLFAPGVHLHVVGQSSGAAASLCSDARDRGASVSVEANGRAVHDLVPHADLVLLNADELRALTGPGRAGVVTRARRLLGTAGGTVVVTRGPAGADAVSATGSLSVPAPPVDVVDRTGAGDAFDAAFLDAWSAGRDVARALDAGLALAAQVLGAAGPRPALHRG